MNRINLYQLHGDLSKPLLGLTEEVYQQLSKEISTIVHNGAVVNGFKSYLLMKNDNVEATKELVRLSITSHLKGFFYISSISALDISKMQNISSIPESIPLGKHTPENLSGYG